MLKFEKLENGNLRVSAMNPVEFAQFIKDHEDDCLTSYTPNSDQAFMELTESYWTNGWGVHTADTLGQLSECLVIVEDSTVEDDGSITLYGKAWANIHNYQVVSPLDVILEDGYIDFHLWQDFEEATNFKN